MLENVSIVAAIGARSRALGKANKLLWRITDDLKRFKVLTSGHTVVMGRKTFESIGHPLPNRTNVVITRNRNWSADGVTLANSIEDALTQNVDTVYVIGGGDIYKAALPYATQLELTLVDSDEPGDTFFPPYETEFQKVIARVPGVGLPQHEFVTLKRT